MTHIEDVRANDEFIQSSGGVRIFVRSWHPADVARGVAVIVPVFNE